MVIDQRIGVDYIFILNSGRSMNYQMPPSNATIMHKVSDQKQERF